MVEAGAKQVTEAQVVGALEAAHAAIKKLVAGIDELKAAVGKTKLDRQGRDDSHPTSISRSRRRSPARSTDAMRIKREARELLPRRCRARRD